MKTVDDLKSLGYDVKTNKGNIRLSYKGEGVPDENRVLPLLQELKANKSEIIKGLQKTDSVAPTVENLCKCGRRDTSFDFGENENGKPDSTFYCSRCNPHKEITAGANSGNVESVVTNTCARCGKPGERYCYGEVTPGKYDWGRFCLECYPHHF